MRYKGKTTETNHWDQPNLASRPGSLKSPILNHKSRKPNPTEGSVSGKYVKKENKNRRVFILYFVLVIFFRLRWRFVSQTEISGKYNSPFSHSSCPKDPVYCFIWYVTIVILTLTSPIDINAPTRDALVLVTKDSFVSLDINLKKKNDDCKQWCLLYRTANHADMKNYYFRHNMNWNTIKVGRKALVY